MSTWFRLPSDPDSPDSDQDRNQPRRPLHLRLRFMVVVFVGGLLGTFSRLLVIDHVTAASPTTRTLLVNIVGSALLGMLLEALVRSGPDRARLRLLRLGLGTGFCGGFTTYSTFAMDVVHTAIHVGAAQAVIYGFATVVLSALAAYFGVRIATRVGLGTIR